MLPAALLHHRKQRSRLTIHLPHLRSTRLESLQKIPRYLENLLGNPRNFCHIDSIALVRSALYDFFHKEDFLLRFIHADRKIPHLRILLFQIDQFMIVRGNQRFRPHML